MCFAVVNYVDESLVVANYVDIESLVELESEVIIVLVYCLRNSIL